MSDGGDRRNGDRGTGKTGDVNGDRAGVMAGGENISISPGFLGMDLTAELWAEGGEVNALKSSLVLLSSPSRREENIDMLRSKRKSATWKKIVTSHLKIPVYSSLCQMEQHIMNEAGKSN